MRKLIYIVLSTIIISSGCKDEIIPGLTQEEAAAALRQALTVGTDTSAKKLSRQDGYYGDQAVKILLPPEADVIFDHVNQLPGGPNLLENTILSINRAAEDAAKEAAPIFKNAITSMTIGDAISIVNGADTSATNYLRVHTTSPLKSAFLPVIEGALSKPLVLNASTESLYSSLIDLHNTASLNGLLFPMVEQNTLSEYATDRALRGLFIKIADEEKLIRHDPFHQVTELLKKVFG